MIDELTTLIEKHWTTYGRTDACERDALSFTKFCQRVVQPHTKVLYLVSYKRRPLCILKTVRAPEYSKNLLREATHQALAPKTNVLSAPIVFWTDEVNRRAVYAEEYIDALPVTLSEYRALLPEITTFAHALPHSGSVRSDEFAERIAPYLPPDPVLQRHLVTLRELKAPLALGLTHGDMGRQNVLGTRQRAWIVDWERSGDVPVHAFDSVDVFLKLNKHATPEDTLLFAVRSIYVALYRRFPAEYQQVAKLGRSMVA
jgi:predicted Ser/Thr protein kinase